MRWAHHSGEMYSDAIIGKTVEDFLCVTAGIDDAQNSIMLHKFPCHFIVCVRTIVYIKSYTTQAVMKFSTAWYYFFYGCQTVENDTRIGALMNTL